VWELWGFVGEVVSEWWGCAGVLCNRFPVLATAPTKTAENTYFSTTHNSATLGSIALKFVFQKDIILDNRFAV